MRVTKFRHNIQKSPYFHPPLFSPEQLYSILNEEAGINPPALEQVDHVHYIQHETLSKIYTNSLYGGQLASRH